MMLPAFQSPPSPADRKPFAPMEAIQRLANLSVYLAADGGFVVVCSPLQDPVGSSAFMEKVFGTLQAIGAGDLQADDDPIGDGPVDMQKLMSRMMDWNQSLQDSMPRPDQNVYVFADLPSLMEFLGRRLQRMLDVQAQADGAIEKLIANPNEEPETDAD